ncbi:MAG: cytochrome b N-terminal domain-containing protein [Deltaproteobacteria bacterium]|nr:cytochrome b N-terminal domain-containing protein [Deltaproteobacteria bacterium]
MNKSLILHFRPKMVDARALRFSMTFGLGGMALVLVFILFFTGLLLKFYYLPFPEKAHDSILYIRNSVLFGAFIRNIHFWSANFLIVITFLHFLRVFFTSAFHQPRGVNWIIGLGLLIIVLSFNFTGYLLPWDQLSFWAVTICTGMLEYIPLTGKWLQSMTRGGLEVGAPTLSIFFAAHTALLPGAMIILLPFHFWRVRKAGGIALSEIIDGDKEKYRVKAIPYLLLREVVTALVLIALILILSIIFDAPTGDKANPGLSPNPSKAPWYFMGFQEILLHIHPFFAVCIIPVIILIFLLVLPFIKYVSNSKGVWFISGRGKKSAFFSFILALVLSIIVVITDEFIPDFSAMLPGIPMLVSNGLIPCFIMALAFAIFYFLLNKIYRPDRNENVQAVFVFIFSVFITFMITGIWFRGSSMKLVWPWLLAG